jgi:hypothetical protein
VLGNAAERVRSFTFAGSNEDGSRKMTSDASFACDYCFEDSKLREYIRDHGRRGNCAWCGSKSRFLVSLDELGPLFREVAVIYDEVDVDYGGDNISYLLQQDWPVFSEAVSEARDDRMQELCVAILEAGLHPKDDVDEPNYHGDFRQGNAWLEESWHNQLEAFLTGEATSETQKESSESSEHDDHPPSLPDTVEFAYEDLMEEYEEGKILFRARIHEDRSRTDRFALAELGAPPSERTPASRANRAGRPVLYLASDEATALAEVRAWKGAAVAVAKMRLRRPSRVIDLLHLKIPDSPFFEEHLAWKLQLAGLFHRLAEELSRPFMPHEADRLYVPTQHLCDLIQQAGYEGVAYPSAMGLGSNLVLFDPTAAEPVEVTYVRVGLVRFDYGQIPPTHEVYEEGQFDYLLLKTDVE